MSYQYNEKYSLLENIVLNEFDRAIKETDRFIYKECGGYQILSLISLIDIRKIGQIILKKGCEPVLNIGGNFIHMTPVKLHKDANNYCMNINCSGTSPKTLIMIQNK